jgi:hypothetical protein
MYLNVIISDYKNHLINKLNMTEPLLNFNSKFLSYKLLNPTLTIKNKT